MRAVRISLLAISFVLIWAVVTAQVRALKTKKFDSLLILKNYSNYQITEPVDSPDHVASTYKVLPGVVFDSIELHQIHSATRLRKDIVYVQIDRCKNVALDFQFGVGRVALNIFQYIADSAASVKSNLLVTGNIFALNLNSTFGRTNNIIISNLSSPAAFITADCNALTLQSLTIDSLKLFHLDIRQAMSISNGSFGKITLDGVTLPRSVYLDNLDLSRLTGFLDLRQKQRNADQDTLFLTHVDLSKILIPLDKFNFVIGDGQTYEQSSILYQQLLKELKDSGLTEKYEEQDKKFQELKLLHNHHWFLNWVSKIWWDYGYNKGRIFPISGALFLFSFIINVLAFGSLRKVYMPDTFIIKGAEMMLRSEKSQRTKAFLLQLPGTLLFTAYVFWGLKLDLKEVKPKSWVGVGLIILQYIAGVVCLAYLANYVISR